MPVIPYGCGSWSTTLADEHKLRVFGREKKTLYEKDIRAEIIGEWRNLQNEELRKLYNSADDVRIMKWRRLRWAGHVVRMENENYVPLWLENRRERDS